MLAKDATAPASELKEALQETTEARAEAARLVAANAEERKKVEDLQDILDHTRQVCGPHVCARVGVRASLCFCCRCGLAKGCWLPRSQREQLVLVDVESMLGAQREQLVDVESMLGAGSPRSWNRTALRFLSFGHVTVRSGAVERTP